MIDLGPHAFYIAASYAVAGLVFGWLIGTTLLANRAATRRLAAMEAREANKAQGASR